MELKKTKAVKLSSFAQKSNTISSKEAEPKRKQLKIAERFILKAAIGVGSFYKSYRAIDLLSRKFVTIYIKPFSKEKVFSKNIKEELKQKVFPPVIWAETEKIDKNVFDIEVHSKYGPSLEEIAQKYHKKISQKTFYLLVYHFLKVADRLDNSGLVCRNITPKSIVFSENYMRNEVYFLNSFDIEKKNQENVISYDPRYCSIGTHLKLRSSSKDTIESICYILLDFYFEGRLFDKSQDMTQKDYLEQKSLYKPEGVPKLFANFFCYVKSLNHNDDIKFTEWKRLFKKQIQGFEEKPYEWIKVKNPALLTESKANKAALKEGFLSAFGIQTKHQESNQLLENSIEEIKMEEYQEQELLIDSDPEMENIDECQEEEGVGKKVEKFQMDRLLQSNNFFTARRLPGQS